MAQTSVLYPGNGSTRTFSIPFPFIHVSHVDVKVNGVLQLFPSDYTVNSSMVTFTVAPAVDSAVVIQRETKFDGLLVQFINGSVLNEQDLNTAQKQSFYLIQETKERYFDLINDAILRIASGTGIVETEPDEVIAALVNEMLGTSAAQTLQDRINDIDANAESILTLATGLQGQINNLAQGTAAVVYLQPNEPVPGVDGIPDPIAEGARWYDSDDSNKPYLYQDAEWISIEDPRIGQAAADIDVLEVNVGDNAAAIIAEQVARANEDSAFASTLGLLGAVNGASTAFILDTNTVKIDSDGGDTFASRLSTLAAADASNAAVINTIQTVDLANLNARYGVTLDVNGHITGFAQNNDGETGSFVIVTDKFALVDPGDEGNFKVPFQYSGGVIQMQNVVINGSLILNGSIVGAALGGNIIDANHIQSNAIIAQKIAAGAITATKINVVSLAAISADLGTITAGNITLNSSGFVKGGQTAYNTGAGFFLGYSSGYKFSIGNGSDQFLTWDGSTLKVRGNIRIGSYSASDAVILSANTERSTTGLWPGASFEEKKKFEVAKPGTVRVKFDVRLEPGTFDDAGEYKVDVDGVQRASGFISSSTYSSRSHDVPIDDDDTIVSVKLLPAREGSLGTRDSFIRNCTLCADVNEGEEVIIN